AELALPTPQRITLRKILRETNERVVDRLVAVRMELADDVADDAGAFLEGRPWVETQQLHGVQQPSMNRLESVARVRERAAGDGRERVLQIALFQRFAQRNLFDIVVAGGNQL